MNLDILFAICLFIALWFWPVNLLKGCRGQAVSKWNFILAAASLTGIVTYFMGIW